MYGKIFDSIYDGTLADNWQALITFQQLIVLCNADGIIDMTPEAISRRTGIPIEHIKAGITVLESPDPQSRTKGENGRRILPIDDRGWGWVIVNHEKYKVLRTEQDRRDYMRNYMRDYREQERKQKSLQKANSKQGLAQLADIDTAANAIKTLVETPTGVPPCPHLEIIKLYHETLPELQRVVIKRWHGSDRSKHLQIRWREEKAHQDLEFWRSFFEVVRTNPHWLGHNDRGWKPGLGWFLKRENFDKVIERGVNQ